MKSAVPLRFAFVFWGVWELANAGLATFAPGLGARMVGWKPLFGWNSDVLAMSQQYGMTMFLLGLAYLLAGTNPVRYAPFVWVAVAEQALGILIGLNDTFLTHTAKPSQLLIFITINTIIAAAFIALRPKAQAPSEVHTEAAVARNRASAVRSELHTETRTERTEARTAEAGVRT